MATATTERGVREASELACVAASERCSGEIERCICGEGVCFAHWTLEKVEGRLIHLCPDCEADVYVESAELAGNEHQADEFRPEALQNLISRIRINEWTDRLREQEREAVTR